jgi:PmbA protein
MSLENTAQLAIDLLKQHPISDYEIALGSSTGVSTLVRLGKVETLEYHLDKSFDISVYINGKKGNASSVDLSKTGLQKAIEAACLIAKYTQSDPFNGLAPKDLMAFNAPDLDLYHPWDLNPTLSIDMAKSCEAAALAQTGIDNSDGAELSSFQGSGLYANSNGLIATQKGTRHSLNCSVIAKDAREMQTAYDYTTALDSQDLQTPEVLGKNAAKLALEKLNSSAVNSQKCPIIFTSKVSGALFAKLLSALSGGAQYKKSTFLLNSLDALVLPDKISLLENPHAQKTLGAKAFDLDGVLKRRQYFVQDGRVKSYIMGQYSANQMGLKTTANAGGVNNIIVKHSFDESLTDLIKTMHQGLVVTEMMGQGVNGITGDYSRGASGFWVENGQISHAVSNVTIAGNLKTMLLGIESIANDVDYRNNIKVGSVLIKQMTLAGKA